MFGLNGEERDMLLIDAGCSIEKNIFIFKWARLSVFKHQWNNPESCCNI